MPRGRDRGRRVDGRCRGGGPRDQRSQANVHQEQGNLDLAEGLYLEARSHAIDSSETRLAAMTAQNLGIISMIRGDHEKALRYYRTSLAEFRTLGAPKEVLLSLNNMGMLCTDLERWDDASRAFEEAVQIAEALGDIPSRVLIEVNRAELAIGRGDFVSACDMRARDVAVGRTRRMGSALGEIEKHLGNRRTRDGRARRRPKTTPPAARSRSPSSGATCCSPRRRRASMPSCAASRAAIATA